MEVRDWTKLLVPRQVATYDDTTTDFVTVPSAEEFLDENNLFRHKHATDFALENGCFKGFYRLRESGKAVNGDALEQGVPDTTAYNGLAPSISLKLPPHYTLDQVVERLGMTQQKTADGATYYQVNLGEYPQTRATHTFGLLQRLREYYANKHESDDFRCTGRLFTTVVNEPNAWDNECFGKRHYPEFIYQGKKYVRVPNQKENGDEWFQVEPITWWVKNFDVIARGEATQIDLDCTQIITGGMPFQTERGYSWQWHNSLIRAFLNNAKDNDPHDQAHDNHWDFTQDGFLQEALNMTREPMREYTIPAAEDRLVSYAFAGCRGLEKNFYF